MSEPGTLKTQVLHSLKWTALGKVVTQLIRWIVTFWVIRILAPEDYGMVAMADVIYSFILLFIGSFFTPILIQAKELSQKVLKQIFGMVLLVYVSCFFLQYILADTIGSYYGSENVAQILKVNAWCFLILAFEIIPATLLARNMKFKQVSIITAIANISAALSTLTLAYLGYGFWALVLGEVIAVTLRTIMTFTVQPINFLPSFNATDLKPYLKFGSLVTLHSILFYVFLHMDVAIAGRILSASEIGFFAVALQFALMPQKKILPLLKQVAFPAFSKIQDQPELINSYILKAQKLSLLITIPIFWGLASVVDLIIPIILGEKWSDAVIPTMIILFIMPLRFSEELFNPAFKSQQKIKHLILNVCIMTAFLAGSILVGAQYGAIGLASAWACGFPLAYVWVVSRNSLELNIHYTRIVRLFVSPVLAGVAMLITVFVFKYYLVDINLLSLTLQALLGALSFIAVLYLADKKSLQELISLVKRNG